MGGPGKNEALRWIQEAVQGGRYHEAAHFQERLRLYNVDMWDVFKAIEAASACLPYPGTTPQHGGTCWRVRGPTTDDRVIAVGVEAFLDKKRRRCILCTIFSVEGEVS